jgi:hypothetical protein
MGISCSSNKYELLKSSKKEDKEAKNIFLKEVRLVRMMLVIYFNNFNELDCTKIQNNVENLRKFNLVIDTEIIRIENLLDDRILLKLIPFQSNNISWRSGKFKSSYFKVINYYVWLSILRQQITNRISDDTRMINSIRKFFIDEKLFISLVGILEYEPNYKYEFFYNIYNFLIYGYEFVFSFLLKLISLE